MADLSDLWKEQQNATFPASCLGVSIDGVPLVRLDAAAGAILTACLRTDGVPRPLPDEARRDLARQRDLIAQALRSVLPEGDGKAYFARLESLASAVLRG